MVKNFFSKFFLAASHHQLLIAVLVGVSLVCSSWAVEKILEEHILASKLNLRSYLITIAIAIIIIWLAKHYILHVI